ncbi:S-layer homology domain-containing protein [Cohnella hongkongensis]|uniref:S-layer homology domain-containing protein n=1 Tax=Cohnella hongkongensis TaxID=178337 RepID=A0ABV9F6Z2_9BACL
MRKAAVLTAVLALAAGIIGGTSEAAVQETLFKDVSKRHWARARIEQAVSRGYVTGYPDGSFHAQAVVTRAEFIKMVVSALRLPHSQGGLPWYQGYVSAALEFGILNDTDSTDYGNPIKRVEMVRILSRALALEAPYRDYLESFQALAKDDMTFEDRAQLQNRDVPYIALAYGAGIVNGFPDRTIQVYRTATRAETIVMMETWLEARKVDPLSKERLRQFMAVIENDSTRIEEITSSIQEEIEG